jgi:hypothetical protein
MMAACVLVVVIRAVITVGGDDAFRARLPRLVRNLLSDESCRETAMSKTRWQG